MAQADTRPGFRLPWSAERNDSDQPTVAEAAESPVADDQTRVDPLATPEMTDAAFAPTGDPVTPEMPDATADPADASETDPVTDPSDYPTEELETDDMMDATATQSGRRPTKFMVELSRAMQGAVETSRDESLARFTADAKAVVEEIHAASTVEAAALRRRADDDVAAVREWSKGEISRIREETEARIATRKTVLDGEIEDHEAVVQARVDQIGATVTDFEGQMAAYFERLLAEEDPTRIASMAESMPEPPDLAGVAASITEPSTARFDPVPNLSVVPPVEADVAEAEAVEETNETAAPSEAEFAAAEAEAAAFSGEIEDDAPEAATADADAVVEPDTETGGEAEAAADATPTPDDAAPEPIAERAAHGERATTRVIVHGLVSVASIATFKRSLGRVSGVSAIGVASGPDGEFVFTVSHDSSLGLSDAITALPGFEARITSQTDDGLEVAAHDPDAGD